MSEISKSLRGKGIFLLAAIVFSSPGRRVVRATCRTNRDAASQIPSKIPHLIFVFILSTCSKSLKVVKCKYCTYLLCLSNFDLELLNLEMYILSMFYILHFLREFICELKNQYHFTGAWIAVQGRKIIQKVKKNPINLLTLIQKANSKRSLGNIKCYLKCYLYTTGKCQVIFSHGQPEICRKWVQRTKQETIIPVNVSVRTVTFPVFSIPTLPLNCTSFICQTRRVWFSKSNVRGVAVTVCSLTAS